MLFRKPLLWHGLIVAAPFWVGCDNTAEFSSSGAQTQAISSIPTQRASTGDQEALPPSLTFRYDLIIGDGKGLIRQGPSQATAIVFEDESSEPLSGPAAAKWKADLKVGNGEGQAGPLGQRSLSLSEANGLTTVSATFTRNDGRSGSFSKTVFVDGEAPKLSLLELSTTPAGDKRSVYWSAVDNFQINSKYTTLYACTNSSDPFFAKSHEDLANLPTTCGILLKPDELAAKGEQVSLDGLSLGGAEYSAASLLPILFAEDMVGLTSAVPMVPVARNAALLLLDSSIKGIQYTNKDALKVPLTLLLLDRGQSTHIDQAMDTWSAYTVSQSRQPDPNQASSAFDAMFNLPLGSTEGLYAFVLRAQDSTGETLSNERSFSIVLDRTPPVVSSVQILVPNGILDEKTMVAVSWSAEDLNGIGRQTLEIQSKGETTWTKLADASGTQREHSFTWGKDRSTKGFSIRVTAFDYADNSAMASGTWSPQFFNAAVLTSSVECFYCHMRIEGDVGGINFPPNSVMDQRKDSGEGFSILGKLYATNLVPNIFKTQIAANAMVVTGGLVENYDNSGVKIFPSQKDANGVPVFPALSVDLLKERMNGTVTNGDGTRYSRIYNGNLVLTGTKTDPIVTKGEFLVNGDLVIKGVYKGIGSIYAKNVFVVDDLISSDCLPDSTTCPYPFAGETEAEKLASAKAAIKAERSALYLAGIQQTLIGGVSTSFDFTLKDPFSWLPLAQYQNLCTQGAYLKDAAGKIFATPGQFYNPTDANDRRARCEVGRVDAFMYGHDLIAWRSYGNYLVNGGFVGYKAALLSTVPYRIAHNGVPAVLPINPRNNMPANRNVIRYDWRLRAGGPGFESLKALFDE